MDGTKRIATAMAIVGNGIFGFSFMFSRIALNITQPFIMLAWRFIVTFIILLAVAATVGKRSSTEMHWLRFNISIRRLPPLLLLGLVQPVGYFLCESYGIALTNATVAGVIIALAPIAAIIGGVIVLHEIPKARQTLYCVLSIVGVCLLTLMQSGEGGVSIWGVVLLFGAVITGSQFNVLSRKLSKDYSVLERTVVMMGLAAATFSALALVTTGFDISAIIAPAREPLFIIAIIYLSVCSSVIAFMALNYANNHLAAVKTTAFANLTTVISLFAGAVFLGEPFGIGTVLISAVIVFCIGRVQNG